MQKVKLHSDKFPGISMVLSDRPSPPGGKGSFEFAVGIEYELSDGCLREVRETLNTYPGHVKNHIRVEATPVEAMAAQPAAAIAAPPKATEAPRPTPVESEPEPEDSDAVELTDDDQELIKVELEKLYPLTVAEGRPLIEKTAGNEALPVVLRRAYLEAIKADTELQKGMKETANEWLELLNG